MKKPAAKKPKSKKPVSHLPKFIKAVKARKPDGIYSAINERLNVDPDQIVAEIETLMKARSAGPNGLTGQRLGEFMDVPTVEKRIRAAMTAVVLVNETIEGLLKQDDIEDPLSDITITNAITDALITASQDLYWLSLLPKTVLEMQAPDDDQKDVMEGGKR